MGTSHRGQVRIGCAGWNYKQWKQPVYDGAPQRLWLTRYAERFSTVEVNSTFYRLPLESTVKTWAEQTPEGFLFAVKVGRYLTHIKRLAPPKSGDFTMLERLAPIVDAGKLGPLLWQLPPAFKRDDERLADAHEAVPRRPSPRDRVSPSVVVLRAGDGCDAHRRRGARDRRSSRP